MQKNLFESQYVISKQDETNGRNGGGKGVSNPKLTFRSYDIHNRLSQTTSHIPSFYLPLCQSRGRAFSGVITRLQIRAM